MFTLLLKKLFTAAYPYCVYCGREYGVDTHTLACPDCAAKLKVPDGRGEVYGFAVSACYAFAEPVRSLIHRYKYDNQRYLHEKIALLMRETMKAGGFEAQAVAHVPLHKNRRKKRGYDQSELIAKKLAELTGVPYIPALARTVDTPSQTHLTREERITNVLGAFVIKADVSGKSILLIDDVLTTGSTAAECARVLAANGAKEVRILVFAKAVQNDGLHEAVSI
jgi:ComF family protein